MISMEMHKNGKDTFQVWEAPTMKNAKEAQKYKRNYLEIIFYRPEIQSVSVLLRRGTIERHENYRRDGTAFGLVSAWIQKRK